MPRFPFHAPRCTGLGTSLIYQALCTLSFSPFHLAPVPTVARRNTHRSLTIVRLFVALPARTMSLESEAAPSRLVFFLIIAASFFQACLCQSGSGVINTWRVWPSVVVLDQWLYILGGRTSEAFRGKDNPWTDEPRTMVLRLNSDWNAGNVQISAQTNPGFNGSTTLAMWPSKDKKKIFTWGGVGSGDSVRLRTFTPDSSGNAGGTWSAESTQPRDSATQQPIYRTGYGSWTSCNGLGFYMGGTVSSLTDTTYPGPSKSPQDLPGLIIYDMNDGKWANVSAKGFGSGKAEGTHVDGSAVCLPDLGTGGKGVVMFLGGRHGSDKSETRERLSLDEVMFYDIGTKRFYSQKTTGKRFPAQTPDYPCSVVAKSKTSKAYDIFMFGGTGQTPAQTMILTVPGFHWSQIQTNDAPAPNGRRRHACAVIGAGGRQMIAFGGSDDADDGKLIGNQDPWGKGLQVLDMTELRWSSDYKSAAPDYEQPTMVKEWYSNASATSTSSPAPAGPSAGVIAGAAVGGVAVLALLVTGIIYFCYYKPRRRRGQVEQEGAELPAAQDHGGRAGDGASAVPPSEMYQPFPDAEGLGVKPKGWSPSPDMAEHRPMLHGVVLPQEGARPVSELHEQGYRQPQELEGSTAGLSPYNGAR
ncbi:hypothetical protein RB598_008986 [Gaeumannomyces tritici]